MPTGWFDPSRDHNNPCWSSMVLVKPLGGGDADALLEFYRYPAEHWDPPAYH